PARADDEDVGPLLSNGAIEVAALVFGVSLDQLQARWIDFVIAAKCNHGVIHPQNVVDRCTVDNPHQGKQELRAAAHRSDLRMRWRQARDGRYELGIPGERPEPESRDDIEPADEHNHAGAPWNDTPRLSHLRPPLDGDRAQDQQHQRNRGIAVIRPTLALDQDTG